MASGSTVFPSFRKTRRWVRVIESHGLWSLEVRSAHAGWTEVMGLTEDCNPIFDAADAIESSQYFAAQALMRKRRQ